MSVYDEVRCNHALFGEHLGRVYQTKDLDAVFPGATYEITPTGRLEMLECTYEDCSDPDATGILRLAGMMTPVYTGGRRDMDFHGWLGLHGFGQAKFTDGLLVKVVEKTETAEQIVAFEKEHFPANIHIGGIWSAALDLFDGDENRTRSWLTSPCRGLGGARPIDYASTESGAQEVRNLIGRLKDGVIC